MDATTVSFATELLLDILLGSFALMSITGLVCTIQSAIYALLGVTFLIHSIADIFDNRRRAKREEEREKRDLEYHEMRMKEFK